MNSVTGIQNHDYYIDGKQINKSVTGVIHDFFGKFDPDGVIDKNFDNWQREPTKKKPNVSPYYGMTKQEIKDMWSTSGKDASLSGSIMHMDIEMFYNYVAFIKEYCDFIHMDKVAQEQYIVESKTVLWQEFVVDFHTEVVANKLDIDIIKSLLGNSNVTLSNNKEHIIPSIPEYYNVTLFHKYTKSINKYPQHILRFISNDSDEFQQFIKFYNESRFNMFPYRTELIMFDEDHQLAGSIDMLFKDTQGNVLIYDWKRSKEFKHSNRWQSGLGCLKHLNDCNIVHYSIQLNMYRHILETHYDEKVTGMTLIRCHPNITTHECEKYHAKNMQTEIDLILETRMKSIKSTV